MAGDAKFQNVATATAGGGYWIKPEEIEALLIPPNWSRWKEADEDPEEWAAFVRSIAEGQLQAVLVRKDAEGNMELVDGRRRRRAVLEINADPGKWGKPAPLSLLVRLVKLKPDEAIAANFRANKSKPLSPVDLASYARELENIGWAREKIAESMGVGESRVGQLLELWRHDAPVLDLVHSGKVKEALARKMLGLPKGKIRAAVERIEAGASPKEVKAEVVAAQREKGKRIGRTLAELHAELKPLVEKGVLLAVQLSEWLSGEPGAASLAEILGEEAEGKAS